MSGGQDGGEAGGTHVLAKLVIVRVLDLKWRKARGGSIGDSDGARRGTDLVKVVFVELADEGGKVGVLEHAREDGLCKLVHVLGECG